MQLERDAAQCGHALVRIHLEVLDAQCDRPGLRLGLLDPQQHIATDHQASNFLFVRVLGDQMADDFATTHHCDPIRDLEDFFQLVRNENDRLAALYQAAQDAEQFNRFLGG